MPSPGDQEYSEAFWASIFRFYYPPVYALFLRRGMSPEDSDDLAQETFLRICRALRKFRHESSLETWIFEIAMNVFRRSRRDSRALKRRGIHVSIDGPTDDVGRKGEYDVIDERATAESGINQLLQEEQRQRLVQAVADLPPQMRQCALLRYQQGLKYREIAVTLDLSIQTVKSHLFSTRERLKGELSESQ